jgi:uncharacterized protein YfdQ (DUF2303 family)
MTTTAITAEAVNAIRDLVKKDHVAVELLALPPKAIGHGRLVEQPHVAIIRKGDTVEIQSLAPHVEAVRGKPLARRGTAQVTSLASFITLVNRHKVETESVIFANTDWRKPSLTAVIDYHVAAKPTDKTDEAFEDAGARNGKHRVHYAYPLSEPWKEWIEANGRKMTQADFAAFLEEHITELAAPTDAERIKWEGDFKAKFATPAELLDLSRGLEVTVGAKVKNRTKLQTGETQMVFEVEYADANGGELVVPGLFLLSVAPFHRGEAIRIPVRLRFRAGGAEIVWFFEMVRPDLFIDERLKDDGAECDRGDRPSPSSTAPPR